MKTLVKRSTALLLTLVLLLTMSPFTALAEAAENEDGMDEIIDILEANEEETDLTVSPDGIEIIDEWNADGDVFPDTPDNPDVKDDWIDWYTDDSENGDESEASWENDEYWEESQDVTDTQGKDTLTLEDAIILRGYAYVLSKRETKVYKTRDFTVDPIFTITEEDAILLVTEYHHQGPECVKIWFIGDDAPMTGYVSPHDLRDELLTDEDVDAYTDLYWWDWVETETGEMYTFYVSGYATVSADEYPDEEWVNDFDMEMTSIYPDFDPDETEGSDDSADEEQTWDEKTVEEIPVMRSATRGTALTAVKSASSLTGTEDVRLGKESSNISGIFVQNNGSSSTSIARHWVTVNGVEYTAFCIEASKSATSGRDGGLESSYDAGLQWIMLNVSDSSDQDYAIKQQALWYYLGQSYPPRDLKAGSRCTLSTDELRAELESIKESADSASMDSRYELWVAYHKEYRSNYQDMIFVVAAPVPTPTPTLVPTPVPTEVPTPIPTEVPTPVPTEVPTPVPTEVPTPPPTAVPTATPFVPTPTPEPMLGWIRVNKADSMTGQGLSGIVFDIYQGATHVSSMTTDENGVAVSDALAKGSYTVKERSVPDGYVADLVSLSCEVKANETTSLTANNTPIRVRIKIIKTDAQTGQPLSGAEFTVKRKDTGAVIVTLTTNAQGEAVSDLLPYGEYTVTESKVPSGYIDSGFTATVNGIENGKTYVIEAENQPMQGGIRITKTDKADGSPIEGVIFDIYQGSTLVGSMTTNASGVAVSGELPVGKYTVKERALPDGYTGDLFSLDCIVVSGELTDLKAENQPIQVKIKVVKTDAQTGQPLSGAEFTVKRKDTGAVVATLITNAQGEAVSDLLPYGEYSITESKIPSGYIDSGFTATINGTENGKTYVIEAENQPMQGGIRITKTDKTDGSPIEGVIFDIYQGTTLVGSMTTNASGVAVSGELPVGKYTVKEHALPDGYTGDLFSVDCIVVSGDSPT